MKNLILAGTLIAVGTLIGISLKDAIAQTDAAEPQWTFSTEISVKGALYVVKQNIVTGETLTIYCSGSCKNNEWYKAPVIDKTGK